jgi:hypothetical protein
MKWVRKVLLLLVVTFAVFYLVTRPVDSANAVRGVFGALLKVVDSLGTFFKSL